jgi:hypothetical protein
VAATRDFTKISANVDLTRGEDVARAQAYINQMAQVMKNLTDEGLAFTSALRKSKDAIGVDFYVAAEKAKTAMKGLEHIRAKVVASSSTDDSPGHDPFRFNTSQVEMQQFQRMILGNSREVAAIKANVLRHGGTFEEGNKKDYYKMSLPKDVMGTPDPVTGAQSTILKELSDSIRTQNKSVRAKEAEKQEKEDKKREEQEAKQEEKETKMSRIKALAGLYLAIKVLHIIADFTKKILEAIGSFASKATTDARTGWSVGMSAAQIYEYGRAEKRRSLNEGTVLGAVQTIQKQFGDISKLDSNAITEIGKTLGEDVVKFIGTGLENGDKPLELLDRLLNGMLDMALKGIHPLTKEQVGVPDAVRAGVTALSHHNPDAAVLLSAMADAALSSKDISDANAARIGFSHWMLRPEATINPSNITNAELSFMQGIDRVLKDIKLILDGIKDGIIVTLAGLLQGMMGGVRNALRLGMTPEMRAADIELAKKENAVKLKQANELKSAIGETESVQLQRLRQLVPDNVRIGDQELAAAGDSLRKGILPTGNLPILRLLANNPAFFSMLQQYGSTRHQSESLTGFIDHLSKELASNETKHVVGDPISTMQFAARNTPVITGKEVFDFIDLTKTRRYQDTHKDTWKERQELASKIAATHGLASNNFGMAQSLSDSTKVAADIAYAQWLANNLYSSLSTTMPSNRIPDSTTARVEFGKQEIVVTILDKEGNKLASTAVKNEGFSESLSRDLTVRKAVADTTNRNPVIPFQRNTAN